MEVADKGADKLSIEACVEAAKILEHKQKNLDSAIHYCKQAVEFLTDSKLIKVKPSLQDIEKRLERLERKCR
jgi:hypothetical protein